MTSRICFVECGGNSNAGWNKSPSRAEAGYFHGLVSNSEWTGVPLATVLNEVGINKKAKWLIAEGADAFAMNMSIPLEKAVADGMLALYQNGERIRPENGYPLRLILPGWEGVLNVKWLRRLKATDKPIMARNETSKYTELLPSGKARLFTMVMEAKSLITSPSANMVLKDPGLYQITGLAWSGRGKIKKVEVSADGGKTWADAQLQEPILAPSAGVPLPGFNPNNDFFTAGWLSIADQFNGVDFDFSLHLILGGTLPPGSGPNPPTIPVEDALIAGLMALGTDPVLLTAGVSVMNAQDLFNAFAMAGTFGLTGLQVASGVLVEGNINTLAPGEISAAAAAEDLASFGGFTVAISTSLINTMGEQKLNTFTDPTGTTTTFIPEPGLAALFVLAVAGIALRRRRRAA